MTERFPIEIQKGTCERTNGGRNTTLGMRKVVMEEVISLNASKHSKL